MLNILESLKAQLMDVKELHSICFFDHSLKFNEPFTIHTQCALLQKLKLGCSVKKKCENFFKIHVFWIGFH